MYQKKNLGCFLTPTVFFLTSREHDLRFGIGVRRADKMKMMMNKYFNPKHPGLVAANADLRGHRRKRDGNQ